MRNALHNLSLRASALAVTLFSTPAYAQVFGPIPTVSGGTSDIRQTALNILSSVLRFMALVAVIFIVIAGISLVASQGEDAEKDKAKKTILYVIIGLIVILLAQAIVDFVANQIGAAGPVTTTP